MLKKNLLQQPEMKPLVNACIKRLMIGGPFCYLDFPKKLGMTEKIFEAIMDEVMREVGCVRSKKLH